MTMMIANILPHFFMFLSTLTICFGIFVRITLFARTEYSQINTNMYDRETLKQNESEQ